MEFRIKDIIKSILLGIIVCFIFTFVLGPIFNGYEGYIMIMGIAIISTIFYCTSLIIKKKNNE